MMRLHVGTIMFRVWSHAGMPTTTMSPATTSAATGKGIGENK